MTHAAQMFSAETNEILTRVGAGTPMGDLMRRYWLPAVASAEIAAPDSPPVRFRLLGEDLIAFKDSEGRIGILDEQCPHRRASLFFGRNEECGLRCAYHGWKFDVEGNCIDLPSEPDYDNWESMIRTKSYPSIERGGAVWIHMGAAENRPPPPEFEFTLVPETNRNLARRLQECNWLQGLEGGSDPIHVPFLHRHDIAEVKASGQARDPLLQTFGKAEEYVDVSQWEHLDRNTEGGTVVVARYDAGDDQSYWRISQVIVPCFSIAPPRGMEDAVMSSNAWVPRDDESCWRWNFSSHPMRPLSEAERDEMGQGGGFYAEFDPVTFRPFANRDNDYLIDRAAQREGRSFSGVPGAALQDSSIQESQGRIHERADENLVAADKPIVMIRQRLLAAIDALERGETPPGLEAAAQRVRPATLYAPRDQTFDEVSEDILETRIGVPLTAV